MRTTDPTYLSDNDPHHADYDYDIPLPPSSDTIIQATFIDLPRLNDLGLGNFFTYP
jgi:hypothetical protein